MALANCFESCGEGIHDYFTNPNNRVTKLLKTREGSGKVIKLIGNLAETSRLIAQSVNAEPSTVDALQNATNLTKVVLDGHSFLNVFTGTIPILFQNVTNVKECAVKMVTGGDANLAPAPVKHNDRAVGLSEKILSFLTNIFKTIAGSAYILMFAICRPIQNIDKYIAKMGEAAKKIGRGFATLSIVNHFAAFFGAVFDMIFQHVARDRALGLGGPPVPIQTEFSKKRLEIGLTLSEKALELIVDGFTMAKHVLHPAATITIALINNCIGIYKEWIKIT